MRVDHSEYRPMRRPEHAQTSLHAKLESLPAAARALLGRAACLGARFEFAEITLVGAASPSEMIARLGELIEAGLLVCVGRDYRLSHDSVQLAAQQLLTPAERQHVHWTIGRRRLARLDDAADDDQLFDVVDHLGAGVPDELERALRVELASSSLLAGRRALASAAFGRALRYLCHGLELLGESGFDESGLDELRFDLAFEHARALSLAGHQLLSDLAFDELLARPLSAEQLALVRGRASH